MIGRLIPSPAATAVQARWNSIRPPDELVAPPLLFAECTSVLSEHVYRRALAAAQARSLIAIVVRLHIRLVDAPICHERAFDIARSLGWAKAYDALYLAAAEHEAAELLTVDGGMHDA
ncbi:MAG: PIN domain-containing protein, partial [Vicinamibacterales bacterium]